MDRRVKRTKKLLSQSFLDLLAERQFQEISIRDITEHADVAYSTFFRNFESKEALLLHYLVEFIVESKQVLLSQCDTSVREKYRYLIQSIFTGVYQCPNIYRILYDAPETRATLKTFKFALIELTLEIAKPAQNNSAEDIPQSLILDNLMNQLFGMIEWWIDHQLQPPPEDMTHYYEKIVLEPAWTLLLYSNDTHEFLDTE